MTASPLEAHICKIINQQGPIGIDRFMAMALGDAEHGYYRRRQPLGRKGDFITAPEISQMFGELIGLWLYQQASDQQILPGEDAAGGWLMELGPGRGTLMADILRSLAMVAGDVTWPVEMVEINPALRASQQEQLAAAENASPIWKEAIESMPPGPVLLVANEFFDALPIRQFVSRQDGWHERQVSCQNGQLALTEHISPVALDLSPQPPGTIAEICPDAVAITEMLAGHIRRHGGAALIIDYGRNSPFGDSLQAVRAHKPVDILSRPGQTDLSAWVDFAALYKSARSCGAEVLGPVDQGTFLKELGLFARAEQLGAGAAPEIRRKLAAAVDRLASPAQMGTLFKVMAILPYLPEKPVAGF